MKTPMFLILLSAIFLLPGLEQKSDAQTPSGVQSAPAPQTTGAAEREKLRPVTSADFWDGDEPNVVNLFRHPFATKKYVRRHTEPIRDRLNELEQITAENTKAIKDVDTRALQGIQLASEKTTLADQHATDAANQTQTAQTAVSHITTRASSEEQIVSTLDQYKASGQTEIRFRPGQSVLTKQAKDALDQMTAPLKDQHNYIIEIRGFSSGSGQGGIASSQVMAKSVVRYLVLNNKIPMHRIFTVGMGNAVAGQGTNHISGGRVEINVLKNDLASAAQP
jgi:outer membrane protein OmpA-like peptidoglycan-associated protein